MRARLTILLLVAFITSFAKTIEVGGNRPVKSLKHAIELAKAGDSILLHKGIYKEGNILLTKSISLIGIGYPVLDGEGKHEILTISGEKIKVKGISFRNAGYSSTKDYAAIKIVDAERVLIEDNRVTNSYFAIHFSNARFCNLRNNKIDGDNKTEHASGNGIHLWKCDNMLVENNFIEGHRDGIYFEFVTHSIIQKNISTRNIRYGLHFMFSNNDAYLENRFENNGAGVAVMFSQKVVMIKNHFDRNWGPSAYGILLKEISDSQIYLNTFSQNTVGILMEGTNRIDVQYNQFNSNGWATKVQASCADNTFSSNNFFANTFDVATNGNLMLNNFSGNYWDKYQGYDLNRNGAGDVPFFPVSMYSMVIEQNPVSVLLLRSFMVNLLDKAEKAIPSLTPETLSDDQPQMK
ncbi:MAG TPA: nitrous oxide reductase family maturation protein NosD, partial [Chitinophagaceae bacterium]|nr:nitrous oxide reductase family maturation protein NosD [Chitinophagaceae bacterium]